MKANHRPRWGNYLGDAVYGSLDGTVTTFAVMAGAVGANLGTNVIIILGLANLFADGFSMAVGSYLSQRSNNQYLEEERHKLSLAIEKRSPEVQQEIREIYREKGFKGQNLTKAVKTVTADEGTWLDEIVKAEGMNGHSEHPIINSITTFTAFIMVGAMPIIPLIFMPVLNFWSILVFVAVVLFLIGSLRSKLTAVSWWRGGLEIMAAGITASMIAYFIGETLSRQLLG